MQQQFAGYFLHFLKENTYLYNTISNTKSSTNVPS